MKYSASRLLFPCTCSRPHRSMLHPHQYARAEAHSRPNLLLRFFLSSSPSHSPPYLFFLTYSSHLFYTLKVFKTFDFRSVFYIKQYGEILVHKFTQKKIYSITNSKYMLRRIVVTQEFENEELAKLAYEAMKRNPSLPFQLPLPPRRVYAEQVENRITMYIIFKGDENE